jgi:hypothetical protein
MLSRFATLGGVPTDPYWANVSYLLVGNGANGTTANIKDSSSNNVATTIAGNTVISTAQSKYGGSSVYFDGTGDYLYPSPSSLFTIYNTNFTIEGWFNCTAVPTYNCIFNMGNRNGGSLGLWIDASSTLLFWYNGLGLNASAVISLNAWHYFSYVKSGSTIYCYLDGALLASTTNSFSQPNNNLTIGGAVNGITWDADYNLNGYLYDFRFTKGIARYTGSTMTVPTGPLPTTGP